ncbi:MAG: gamma-glutamyltransferase [Casimicrobiaceae bacterium]
MREPMPSRQGVVTAAQERAARAGARLLAAGGNAADAAAGTAAMLAVVDPANCGIGGYGGFAVAHRPGGRPMQIGFNAAPARAHQGALPRGRGTGALVTPPNVVAGLCALHREFGRLDARAVWQPAIDVALEGFAVGKGLAAALRWAHANHRGLNGAFRATFYANGEPLREGMTLRQPALARTLEGIADMGDTFFAGEPVFGSVIRAANAAGGVLTAADADVLGARVTEAAAAEYEGAAVWSADPAQCGASVLLASLRHLDGGALGERGKACYVEQVRAALVRAWQERESTYRRPSRATSQTSHLCAVDDEGLMIAMTFTHGPLWFGSGLVTEETGIVLNSGAHLLVERTSDGRTVAQPHLAPTILQHAGTRYALGSPGGTRIPAIVLQGIVDLVHYGTPVEALWDEPRLSANADGSTEAEPELVQAFPALSMRRLGRADFFGPASALGWTPDRSRAGLDHRFDDSCAAFASGEMTRPLPPVARDQMADTLLRGGGSDR